MKNPNKDYIVDVNVKTSTVSASSNLKFAITDINTSNIFFRLVFNESSNSLVNSYAPQEDSSNYKLTLRIVKPSNQPIDIEATLLDQNSNFFIVDLPDNYKDVIGIYVCELFIDTNINGRLERSTTNSFTYEVVKSIYNGLDGIIEGDDYPLVDTLATREYVDTSIANAVLGGTINLDSYVTDKELEEALANINTGNIDLTGYATTNYVDEQISTIELTPGPQGEKGPKGDKGDTGAQGPAGKDGAPGADGLTTSVSVNGSVYTHVNGTITLPDYPSIEGLATESYVNNAIANIDTSGGSDVDLSLYATKANPVFTGSISMGRSSSTTKIGSYSIALGYNVLATGDYSFAEGKNTKASSICSHAEGWSSIASGNCSHAEGLGTIASQYQHVQGKYNIEDNSSTYVHIVGNGTDAARSNAYTLDWSGNAWYQGEVYVGGTGQKVNSNKLLSTADIHFDESGNLVVTIGATTKTFAPIS